MDELLWVFIFSILYRGSLSEAELRPVIVSRMTPILLLVLEFAPVLVRQPKPEFMHMPLPSGVYHTTNGSVVDFIAFLESMHLRFLAW